MIRFQGVFYEPKSLAAQGDYLVLVYDDYKKLLKIPNAKRAFCDAMAGFMSYQLNVKTYPRTPFLPYFDFDVWAEEVQVEEDKNALDGFLR